MKKRWTALLLCTAMLLSASVRAWAAGSEDAGFYRVGSAETVEIVPITASGEAVTGVLRNVDGAGEAWFYPGSAALRVTLTDTAPGKMVLLTVSAGETVYYADQRTGGGTLSFVAAFTLPGQRTDMTLSIGSNAAGFQKITVPLSYTPHAEGTPSGEPLWALSTDYEACPRDEACVMAAFTDLAPGAWYHDGVHFALGNQIMNGVGGGQFSPDAPTSRAMLVTVLWRVEGMPVVNGTMTFADVPPDTWYTEAVRWAAATKLVNGYSARMFGPEDQLTREQLATILSRYAWNTGMDAGGGDRNGLNGFADARLIADWAEPAFRWAVDAGIIVGTGDGKLSPQANASRAQVATMLMRLARAAPPRS